MNSWQHYALDPTKVVLLALLFAAMCGLGVGLLTLGVLRGSSAEVSIVASAVVCYLVLSFPKRLLESSALSQSREAPALAVMGSANIEATRSRSMSILLLRSGNPEISVALREARRLILLGHAPPSALGFADRTLVSYSARNVLRSVATERPATIVEGGEETLGMVRTSQLSEESTVPLFTTVAFFAPMMLLLYATMGGLTDPVSLGELVALDVVFIDIAFHFSSPERRKL